MKVILNEIIKDIQGNEIVRDAIVNNELVQRPVKLCDILYDGLLAYRPYEDSVIMRCYELAKKMVNLSNADVQEIEITNEELALCQDIMKREDMIIRAKFIEMVDTLNSDHDVTEESILIENPIEQTPEEIHEEIPEETPEDTDTKNIITE